MAHLILYAEAAEAVRTSLVRAVSISEAQVCEKPQCAGDAQQPVSTSEGLHRDRNAAEHGTIPGSTARGAFTHNPTEKFGEGANELAARMKQQHR